MIWSVIEPFGGRTAHDILANNRIGSNTGNLLFHASAARTLMTEQDDEFEPVFASVQDNLEETAQRANRECALFAIPLANAFRADYMDKLDALTQFVRRLKIPCVVMGVGIQAGSVARLDQGFAYDDRVTAFVSAVLEKSAMLGVRGAMTARYLTRLGFREEEHFTQIGCPSMYMLGEQLPEPRLRPLTRDSRVCVNSKLDAPMAVHRLIQAGCEELPNYWYVPQRIEEIWMMAAGVPMPFRRAWKVPAYFPARRSHPLLKRGRSVAFLSVEPWLDFMRDMDFSFGCNIHGNIAACLAGVPGLVVPKDLRVVELAEFFEMPMLRPEDGMSVLDAFAQADFSRTRANHGKRFAHYVDFLNANGVAHSFGMPGESPYDAQMHGAKLLGPVLPRGRITLKDTLADRDIWAWALEHYWIKYKRRMTAGRRKAKS